jgi:hypothetical protein
MRLLLAHSSTATISSMGPTGASLPFYYHIGTPRGQAVDTQGRASALRAVAHHVNAEMAWWDGIWIESLAIVANLELNGQIIAPAAEAHNYLMRSGMLDGVGERLLRDAVQGNLYVHWERGVVVFDSQRDGDATAGGHDGG